LPYLKSTYKTLNIAAILFLVTNLNALTIRLNQVESILPAQMDIPDDWKKNLAPKENGVILTVKNGNAEMEVRNFVLPGVDMDYLINALSARMYAKYSYINILLEKKEDHDNLKKETLYWEMRYQGKTFYEKTVIQKYENNIVILSCIAPANEYQENRVIFENAVLSIRFTRLPVPENNDSQNKDQEREGDTKDINPEDEKTPVQTPDKTEINKEIREDVPEKKNSASTKKDAAASINDSDKKGLNSLDNDINTFGTETNPNKKINKSEKTRQEK